MKYLNVCPFSSLNNGGNNYVFVEYCYLFQLYQKIIARCFSYKKPVYFYSRSEYNAGDLALALSSTNTKSRFTVLEKMDVTRENLCAILL